MKSKQEKLASRRMRVLRKKKFLIYSFAPLLLSRVYFYEISFSSFVSRMDRYKSRPIVAVSFPFFMTQRSWLLIE